MDNVHGGGFAGESFPAHLANYIGKTVTIFTSSGGQSGSGFTGVILTVNECIVRLLTRIGPPPGCSLANACTGFNVGYSQASPVGVNAPYGANAGFGTGPVFPAGINGAAAAGGWNGYPVYTVGSVTDIPISSIVSFVHSAV